jgi:hypothetical protein
MTSILSRLCPFFLVLVFGAVAGCGPSLQPVEGDVSVNGSPLAKGNVVFWPDAAKGNTFPNNPTGEVVDGKFKIMTQGKPGAPAGAYKVTVNSSEIPDSTKVTEFKNPIPEKYREAAKTPLTIEVPSASYSFKVSD